MTDDTDELLQLMTDVVNVRRWRQDPVPDDILEKLLQAFRVGPSTGQPWEMLRLESPEAKDAAISATLEPLMTPHSEGAQRWLADAPVLIAVCLEMRRAMARLGAAGRGHALQDVGSALQNLRIMANALGLRTGVVREFDAERMREALGLSWFMEPVALIAVGYSDSYLEYPPRYSLPEFYRVHEPPDRARTDKLLGQEDDAPVSRPESSTLTSPRRSQSDSDADAPVPAIYRRRSIRRYTGQPLEQGILQRLLDAATRAPSSGNMQPWEFIVLESDDIRKAAVATTYSGYFAGPDNQQSWMLEASAIVAVCTNRRRTMGRYGERLAHQSVQDAAAATENLMITATEMGLGTCWVGGVKADVMTKLLGIPEGVQVLSMVAIGYPAHSPAPRTRLPLDMLTHRDHWGVPYFERG